MSFSFHMPSISVSFAAKTVLLPVTLCLLFEQKDIIHLVEVLLYHVAAWSDLAEVAGTTKWHNLVTELSATFLTKVYHLSHKQTWRLCEIKHLEGTQKLNKQPNKREIIRVGASTSPELTCWVQPTWYGHEIFNCEHPGSAFHFKS